jgi:hypothetical protein
MELAIELLSTLESLEAKGMHKQADQLANVMIRMADEFSDLDTAVQQVATLATKTLGETESIFFNNYKRITDGFTNQVKINMLENYLIRYPEHSNYMKPVLEDLLQDLKKEGNYSKSSFARSTNLKNALDKTGLLDSFKEINPSLNSAAELELLLAQKELANAQSANKSDDIQKALEKVQNATDKVNLEKSANPLKKAEDALELAKKANKSDDEIKALEEAVKAAKGAAKPSNAAQLDDAVSLVTKISEKLPILKSILPSLGNVLKFAGIAGVVFGGVSALAGLNADFSKYSWEEIRSDSLLSMRFGHNLILLLTALGQVIPIPGLGLILGGLEFLINPLFESQYKAVSERQKKSLEENLTLARKHVENLISSDPKIKLLDIKYSVEKYYDWSATGSIINKKAIEDFLNIEVPKMLKDAKNKNESEKLWGNVPQMQPGTGMAGNFNKQTGKWEFKQLANNRENRIMVAALVDAARQYEREQRYAESDYTFNAARMAFG